WARLHLDKTALEVERGRADEAAYQKDRAELASAIEEETAGRTYRTPRLGIEGCCGRGCNGCLHFWHDDRYAKARELLRHKKQGQLLDRADRD
ncbi:MAG: peptidase U32, partial [Bdellovibrionales bacterium]